MRFTRYIGLVILLLPRLGTSQDSSIDEKLMDMRLYAYTDYKKMVAIGEELLENATSENRDWLTAKVDFEHANHFYYTGHMDAADSAYSIVITKAKKVKDRLLANKARVRRMIARNESNTDMRENAKQARKLMHRFQREGDRYNEVDATNALAQAKIDLYERDSGLYYYLQALDIAKAEESDHQYAYLINNVGLFRMGEGEIEEALEDFMEGYSYTKNRREARLRATLASNIGLIHMRQDSFPKAREYFHAMLRSGQAAKAPLYMITAHMNLGTTYIEEDNYAACKLHYDSALYHMRLSGMMTNISTAYNALARRYLKTGNYQQTLVYTDSGLAAAIKYGQLTGQMVAHRFKSDAYDSLGQYQLALDHHRKVKLFKDSITELNKNEAIAQMQTRYDLKEAEAELIQQDAKIQVQQSEIDVITKQKEIERIELQNRQRIIIGVSLLALLVISVLWYMRYAKQIRKQRESFSQNLIQNIEEERGRIARDLHDDIGQTLSMIKNKVGNNNGGKDPELESSLQQVIEQTREISRSLYPSYLRKVGITEALHSLIQKVESSTDLVCTSEITDVNALLDDDQRTHLYRIVQECINNTLKHAKASAIKLNLGHKPSGEIEVIYRDNGVGLQSKRELTGMGMMSIAERVRILDGDLSVSSNKGEGIRIIIKFSSNVPKNAESIDS